VSSTSFVKRQKERQRQEKQRDKAAKKEERKRTKPDRPNGEAGEDPDLAGIIPGPQPVEESAGT
jgi:hypothetical protein